SIAQSGAWFSTGYVTASVCSPSRAGLITGRYQQRFGHECNLNGQAERAGLGMSRDEETVADLLRRAGYRTGLIGKWHLGSAPGLRPLDRGFDEFMGLWQGSRSYFKEADSRRPLRVGGRVIEEPDDLYLTTWMGDRAVDFIAAHRDEPFFLYLSHTAPHTPMEALEDDLEAARSELGASAPDRRVTYAAMMRSLDRSVGRVLDAIDDAGLRDRTVVFFINDNGGATNNGSENGPLRGMKGSKWEGGVRVPYAVRWPGMAAPGRRVDGLVSSLDIAATIAAHAGIEPKHPLDGEDLRPILIGERDRPEREALFWRRSVAAAVRTDRWKLIRSEGNPTLLFDLTADEGERIDLSASHPDVLAGLISMLSSWESEMIDPLWREGERWERNQRRKHRLEVLGREAERRFP
ncbi:MAG: sulfatase-like hydrolase/transferase, partial [Planctomycetota bacterium]